MKVAISASGKDLNSSVDSRFGRCPYFLIYDTDTKSTDAIDNTSRQEMGGAGIKAAQFIVDNGVDALLTGNVGPNAYRVLSSSGIKIYTGISGNAGEAVNRLINGELGETDSPSVGPHFGMNK